MASVEDDLWMASEVDSIRSSYMGKHRHVSNGKKTLTTA